MAMTGSALSTQIQMSQRRNDNFSGYCHKREDKLRWTVSLCTQSRSYLGSHIWRAKEKKLIWHFHTYPVRLVHLSGMSLQTWLGKGGLLCRKQMIFTELGSSTGFSHDSSQILKAASTYMSHKFHQSIHVLGVCEGAGIHKEMLSCSKGLNCSPHED